MGDFEIIGALPAYKPTKPACASGSAKEEGTTLSYDTRLRVRLQVDVPTENPVRVRERGQLAASLSLAHSGLMRGNRALPYSIEGGLGLASGIDSAGDGDDQRSYNFTFDSNFGPADLGITSLYLRLALFDIIELNVGKFANPLFTVGDYLWDSDIYPEGGSLSLNFDFSALTALANLGVFILGENKEALSPFMIALQFGLIWPIIEQITLTSYFSYFDFQNVEGWSPNYSSRTFPRGESGGYRFGINAFEFGISLDLQLAETRLSLSGGFIKNLIGDEHNLGYFARLGISAGFFQGAFSWRNLEPSSWVDFLPDSDANSGGTNQRCLETEISFRLLRRGSDSGRFELSLGADYYLCQPNTSTPVMTHVLQINLQGRVAGRRSIFAQNRN